MSRHRQLHLAMNLDQSLVAQCDCDSLGNHAIASPYHICVGCAEVYMTEYVYLASHRNSGRDVNTCPRCGHAR